VGASGFPILAALARSAGASTSRGRRCVVCLVTLLLLQLGAAAAQGGKPFLEGRVVAVLDGDTIDVLIDGARRRIRLAGIDTPERGQPWAERAKQALSERVYGKQIQINEIALDRYGRTVGEVYADNVCVGCELVREGHAWVYLYFSQDPVLLELEAQARAAGRGLWSLPESQRTPPWEWRREHRARESGARARRGATPEARDARFDCGKKRRCSEMTSCAEARFYQTHCGVAGLDGDADGKPCEALCGRE
jgi:endonuclease YncB( thermonuclease family)